MQTKNISLLINEFSNNKGASAVTLKAEVKQRVVEGRTAFDVIVTSSKFGLVEGKIGYTVDYIPARIGVINIDEFRDAIYIGISECNKVLRKEYRANVSFYPPQRTQLAQIMHSIAATGSL